MKNFILLLLGMFLFCCAQPVRKTTESPPYSAAKSLIPFKSTVDSANKSGLPTGFNTANMSRRELKLYKAQLKAQVQIAIAEAKKVTKVEEAKAKAVEAQALAQAEVMKPPAPPSQPKKIIKKIKVDNSQRTTSSFPWWVIIIGLLVTAFLFFKPKWL